jgi:hypothetical protein
MARRSRTSSSRGDDVKIKIAFLALVSSDGLRDLDRTHGNDALDRERGSPMTGFLIIMGGITIFVGIITLLDWLARRKERRSER